MGLCLRCVRQWRRHCFRREDTLLHTEAHRRFIADAVVPLRSNLSGLERLTNLIAQLIGALALLPPGDGFILCRSQKELGIGGLESTRIGRQQLTALGFLQALPIIETVLDGLLCVFFFTNFVLLK